MTMNYVLDLIIVVYCHVKRHITHNIVVEDQTCYFAKEYWVLWAQHKNWNPGID
jgi:hypothetical protein